MLEPDPDPSVLHGLVQAVLSGRESGLNKALMCWAQSRVDDYNFAGSSVQENIIRTVPTLVALSHCFDRRISCLVI